MSKAYAAIRSELWVGDDGSPEQYFKVARVGDIAGPKSKRETIDTTTHDTDDSYREFIASLKDGQEVTFPIILDPNDATHNEAATVAGTNAGGLKYLLEAGDVRNMRIQMPTSPTTRFRFRGLVTGFEPDLKVTGAIGANITIKVSKKPTMEVGTGSGA